MLFILFFSTSNTKMQIFDSCAVSCANKTETTDPQVRSTMSHCVDDALVLHVISSHGILPLVAHLKSGTNSNSFKHTDDDMLEAAADVILLCKRHGYMRRRLGK